MSGRPHICVIGAGTIGSLLAAHLARVTSVTVLTRRPEHANAILRNGIRIAGKRNLVSFPQASAQIESIGEPEIVFLACKGTDVAAVARELEGRFPEAWIVTMQNGLGAEEEVRRHGPWPLISGFTFMSGTRLNDHQVEYVLEMPTWLGPYGDTRFSAVTALADLLNASGLTAVAVEDIEPTRWSKLIFNASVNTVAALTGLPHDAHFSQRTELSDLGHLVFNLVEEGRAVAAALGIAPTHDPWEMNVVATERGSRHYPSMLEDLAAGRPTEIDFITGALVRKARTVATPVPLSAALYSLVRAREEASV